MWLIPTSPVVGNLPFRFCDGAFIVGRTKRSQIVIADSTVSRQHSRFNCTGQDLVLQDLDSSNGTFVNERRITWCNVYVGDHVCFGGIACAIATSPLACQQPCECESTFHIRRVQGGTNQLESFTPAQHEIIEKVMEGHGETQIAVLLGKSPHTIHTHLKAIFKRVGVHSRAELIVRLTKSG